MRHGEQTPSTNLDEGDNNKWEDLEQHANHNFQNTEEDTGAKERILNGEYNTEDEIGKSLNTLRAQLKWRQRIHEVAEIIESGSKEGLDEYGRPKWKNNLLRKTIRRGYEKYEYFVKAITNEDYNNSNSTKLATPEEKRILIYPELGYAHHRRREPLIINGFAFYEEGYGSLPETVDFTIENRPENKSIPERINNVLFGLFGKNEFSEKEQLLLNNGDRYSYHYLDFCKYPDDKELAGLIDEMKKITNDIGEDGIIEEKIECLAQKQAEIEKARREAEEREKKLADQQKLSEIEISVRSGNKLSIDELRLAFDDNYNNNSSAIYIRDNLGIEESAIRELLK